MRCGPNSTVKLPITFMAIAFTIIGCSDKKTTGDNEVHDCSKVIDNKTIFLGTKECLKALPEAEIGGILVHSFEYSVLFDSIPEALARGNPSKEMWVYLDEETEAKIRTSSNEPEFYRIRFLGSKSSRPGLYGHMGQFGAGVVVNRVIQLERLQPDH